LNRSSPDSPLLTVVIPTYNEKERIGATLTRVGQFLAQQPYASTILVVDDGSTDGTPDVVQLFAGKDVPLRIIAGQHRGKAYAVRTGMLAAQSRYALFSDADLSTPIEAFADFLPCFEQGCDVVIASREAPGALRIDEPWSRHLMGRVFTRIVHVVTGQRFEDTQCGFKAFTLPAARAIFSAVRLYGEDSPIIQRSKVTGFDVEVLFLARKLGFRIREVPVHWYYAAGSKVSPLRDSLQNLQDAINVRLNDLRGLYNH